MKEHEGFEAFETKVQDLLKAWGDFKKNPVEQPELPGEEGFYQTLLQ